MHAGRNYTLKEVLYWTRREIFALAILGAIPTALYSLLELKWLAIPWLPIALVGTAAAFIVGFKNNATYSRLWDARAFWGSIVNSSRNWGLKVTGYLNEKSNLPPAEQQRVHKELIYRHFAWLTALRYQLREERAWENMHKSYNAEYQRLFKVAECDNNLEGELAKYLTPNELKLVIAKTNKATQILNLQSAQLKALYEAGNIDIFYHVELQNLIAQFADAQGQCERMKNFPYPRQFATINLFFVRLFVFMVPFGMLQEFEKLGSNLVWLTIPFSVIVSWVFHTMEKIGESTENPFEGNANDVPITALSRTIEIDLREMLNETEIPAPLQPVNNILM